MNAVQVYRPDLHLCLSYLDFWLSSNFGTFGRKCNFAWANEVVPNKCSIETQLASMLIAYLLIMAIGYECSAAENFRNVTSYIIKCSQDTWNFKTSQIAVKSSVRLHSVWSASALDVRCTSSHYWFNAWWALMKLWRWAISDSQLSLYFQTCRQRVLKGKWWIYKKIPFLSTYKDENNSSDFCLFHLRYP